MKKNILGKDILFEMMKKVNPTFILKEEFYNEADKSSYSTNLIDDITVLLGNRQSLSPDDMMQLTNSHNVSPEEVQQTVDYILSNRKDTNAQIPTSSKEAEEVNDLFKRILDKDPQKRSMASLWYIATLDDNLAKPKTNPMVGRFIKLTKYMFPWADTYAKAVERGSNPDWEIQQRKGEYTKVQGYEGVLERDKRGDEVLPILVSSAKAIVLVLDEAGNPFDLISTKELQGKYGQYFTPSFFTPYKSGSGVDNFRPFKLYKTYRIAAGGEEWFNTKMKSPLDKYTKYFKDVPND